MKYTNDLIYYYYYYYSIIVQLAGLVVPVEG